MGLLNPSPPPGQNTLPAHLSLLFLRQSLGLLWGLVADPPIPFLCRGHKGTAECWGVGGWIVTYVDSSKGAQVACLCLGRGQR